MITAMKHVEIASFGSYLLTALLHQQDEKVSLTSLNPTQYTVVKLLRSSISFKWLSSLCRKPQITEMSPLTRSSEWRKSHPTTHWTEMCPVDRYQSTASGMPKAKRKRARRSVTRRKSRPAKSVRVSRRRSMSTGRSPRAKTARMIEGKMAKKSSSRSQSRSQSRGQSRSQSRSRSRGHKQPIKSIFFHFAQSYRSKQRAIGHHNVSLKQVSEAYKKLSVEEKNKMKAEWAQNTMSKRPKTKRMKNGMVAFKSRSISSAGSAETIEHDASETNEVGEALISAVAKVRKAARLRGSNGKPRRSLYFYFIREFRERQKAEGQLEPIKPTDIAAAWHKLTPEAKEQLKTKMEAEGDQKLKQNQMC